VISAKNYPLNCGGPTATFVRQFAKRSRPERRFDLATQQINRITTSGTASTATLKDRVLDRQTGASSVADYELRPDSVVNTVKLLDFSVSSDSESILSIDNTASGFVARHVTPGSTTVRMVTQDGETQSATLATSASTGGVVDTFSEWADTSLARHMTDQIVGRFSGKAPLTPTVVQMPSYLFGTYSTYSYHYRSSELINLFSSWPGNTHVVGTGLATGHQNPDGPWIRSTTHWLADVDLTCVSGWNVGSNGVIRATMVSPEHWICCKHGWEPKTGDTLRFIGRNAGAGQAEQVSVHTVTETVNLPGRVDFRVGRISPPLPDYISFAKVLPKTSVSQLPGVWYDAPIPAFKLNQDFQALPVGTGSPRQSFARLAWGSDVGVLFGELEFLGQFTNYIRFLDSGNPTFVLVNGEAVLVSTHSSAVGGPFVSDDTTSLFGVAFTPIFDQINTAMTTLGGGYQLTTVDLSGFPTY
jgi:hypothetical protein